MAQWIGSREVAFILANAPELTPPPADWLAKANAMIFKIRSTVRTSPLTSARSRTTRLPSLVACSALSPPTHSGRTEAGIWERPLVALSRLLRQQGSFLGSGPFTVIFTDHPGPSWAFYSASGGSCYVDMVSGLGVIAMENLHVITQFGDLYGIQDSPGGFDVMDCACGTHPSAFTKIELGWIDPGAVVTVPIGTPSRSITLHALGSALALAPTPGRAHALMIPAPVGPQVISG